MGIISPLYKGNGKTSDVTNYLPVTITDSLSKNFEKVLVHYMDENLKSFVSPHQHGLLPGRSTLSNLLENYLIVTNLIDSGKPVDVISIDLLKRSTKLTILFQLLR